MPLLLSDWFHLKNGRDNFKPNPLTDSQLILCHEHVVSDEILGSIERRFASNEPVKMLLYGDWGVGKTHTINHISWWLEQNHEDYPAHTVRTEIGDISKTTKSDVLVHQFLDAMGLDHLIELAHDYLRVNPNIPRALEESGVPAHVATAVAKLLLVAPGETPSQIVLQAFDYLKGRKPAALAMQMGFGSQLTDSTDLYGVLLAVSLMYRSARGHRLIFIADEAAKLEAVEADEATSNHWVNVNKSIFDDSNNTFGFIYTFSGRRKTLPRALFEPQLENRLGDNVFELKNLAPSDVGIFLSKLRENFIDQNKVNDAVAAGLISSAAFDWNCYPFTVEGHHDFVDFFSRAPENAKPRNISSKLNDVAFIAAKSDKRLIDSETLQKAQM